MARSCLEHSGFGLWRPRASARRPMRAVRRSHSRWRQVHTEQLESRRMLAALETGDANQDYWFDEADLIHAFKIGKFETGEPATWSEGDWDGGPGSSIDDPPEGDGEFDIADLVAAFANGAYKRVPTELAAGDPVHARVPLSLALDGDTAVEYDVETGDLRLVAALPPTTFHLHSNAGLFVGAKPQAFSGLFDVFDANNLFFFIPVNPEETVIEFGRVLPPGLDGQTLLADLSVDGSSYRSGGLGAVSLSCDCLARDRLVPLGSNAWAGEPLTGELEANAPAQEFQLDVRAGERLALLAETSGGLRATVTVVTDDGTPLASELVDETPTLLSPLDITADGIVTVRVVADNNSAGAFEVRPFFNAVAERETFFGEANDTRDAAESIASTFQPAPFEMQTSLVVGELEDDDWYTFTPTAGEYFSLLATSADPTVAPKLELYSQDGSLIAEGMATRDVESILNNVRGDGAPWMIRVSGEPQSYSLFTIRNGQYEVEPNDTRRTSQPLSITGNVIGYADAVSEDWHGYIGDPDVAQVSVLNSAGRSHPFELVAAHVEGLSVVSVAEMARPNQYFLHAEESLPTSAWFQAAPRDGHRIASGQTMLTIESLYPVRPASVDAAALTVDGVAATSVTMDGNSLSFQLPDLDEGPHELSLTADSFVDVTGRTNPTLNVTIIVDSRPPRVVRTIPPPRTTMPADIGTVEVQFSESVVIEDLSQVLLIGASTGELNPIDFEYDSPTSTLSIQYDFSQEDEYTLWLRPNGHNFRDEAQWPLDGNADGVSGGDFSLTFTTDIDQRAVTAFEPVGPNGSAAYKSVAFTGLVGTPDDFDGFRFELDENQVLSANVTASLGLVPGLRIYGPDNQLLAEEASPVLEQSVAAHVTEAGTYLVVISGWQGTTGRFDVEFGVNMIQEDAGRGHDQLERAWQVDSIMAPLTADVSQITVQGELAVGPIRPVIVEDFADATLPDGWSIGSSDPDARVRLTDELGTRSGEHALLMDSGTAPLAARTPATLVFYDPVSGELSFDTVRPLSTIELRSTAGIFTGSPAENLGQSLFDVDEDDKIFKLDPEGFDDLSFGSVAAPGLSYEALSRDLRMDGSYLSGGRPDFSLVVIEEGVRAEAVWTVDLGAVVEPTLEFWHASWNDSPTVLPISYEGSVQGDGVSISADGQAWYRLFTPSSSGTPGAWVRETIDVFELARQVDLPLDGTVQFKFQHYGSGALPDQGRGYDLIRILEDGPDQDWHSFELQDGETVTLTATSEADDELALSLFDAAGNPIIDVAAAHLVTLQNFEDATNDGVPQSYVVRVAGAADVSMNYELVVTKNGGFDVARDLFPVPVQLEEGLNFVYDAETGQLDLISNTPLTVMELFSDEEIFNGTVADFPGGNEPTYYSNVFDRYDPRTLFLLDTEGFGTGDGFPNFANVGPDRTAAELAELIRVRGRIAQGPPPCCDITDIDGGVHFVDRLDAQDPLTDLTTAGSYVGYLTERSVDYHRIELDVGEEVTLTTTTPAGGPLLFENLLDPSLVLTDLAGNEVTRDDNGSADGRNARLTYVADAAGVYRITVRGEGSGEYVISAEGSFAVPGLSALQTSLQDNSLVTRTPNEFRVRFNRILDPRSIQAGDLLVDGVPATELEIVDPHTIVFGLSGLSAQASHQLIIPAGALSDTAGRISEEVSVSIQIDSLAPTVTGISFEDGVSVPTGSLTVEVTFSEAIRSDVLGDTGIQLVGALDAIAPSSKAFDPQTLTLTLGFDEVPEGRYDLRIRGSSPLRTGVEDLAGNPLARTVSRSLVAIAPSVHYSDGFIEVSPQETFAFESQPIAGSFDFNDDIDSYTFDVAAGQLINVVTHDSLGRHVATLLNPDGEVLSSQSSGSTMSRLAAVSAQTGRYTVILESTTRAERRYQTQILLNQIAEAEGAVAGSNNSPFNATRLDNWMRGVGLEYVSVRGDVGADDDYYVISVPHRGRISVGAESVERSLTVEILDANLNVITEGGAGANFSLAIDSLQDQNIDGLRSDFYIRVATDNRASRPYRLYVNRGVTLESQTGTTSLGPSMSAVGNISAGGEDEYVFVAEAGSAIDVELFVPYAGNDTPSYSLESSVRLVNPDGQEVSADPNRLTHVAAATGTYRAIVAASSGTGGYLLSVQGEGTRPVGLRVVDVNPTAGTELIGLPGHVTFTFTHALSPGSVDATDVLIGGQPAARVVQLAANAYGFVPALQADRGNGLYEVELLANSVLTYSGIGNELFQSSFSIARSSFDLDQNGSVDGADLDAFCMAVAQHGLVYDYNQDQRANRDDFYAILINEFGTVPGDINVDGTFNSGDLVDLLQAGTLESGETDAVWSLGDFDCDGQVRTSDLVEAFRFGAYDRGAAGSVATEGLAPKPASDDLDRREPPRARISLRHARPLATNADPRPTRVELAPQASADYDRYDLVMRRLAEDETDERDLFGKLGRRESRGNQPITI